MINKNTSKIIVEELASKCNTCGHCCRFGSGIVLQDEIKKLSESFGMKPEDFQDKYLDEFECFSTKHFRFKQNKKNGKPYGSCIFLDNNKCKIQNIKPLYCRIGNCNEHGDALIQWFHLNYSVDEYNPDSIREWNIYSQNKDVISGGKPTEIVKDEETLKKILSYEILK